ncbi:ABC-2 type transport system permease protein [Streptomyces canus]|uniref:ABC transporter permease n=1 Tax=unclassified Streptomyces TaxID=2593676 RepID=UPI000F651865|nr:ABC transporter permease [Streptomyces sp. RP5T]RRR78966.1 ABC transporter [Streptomyces sp. RP5T]
MAQTDVHGPPTTKAGPPGPAAWAAGRDRALTRDLRTIRVLWRRETIRFGRNKLRIAMGMVTPLMFLLILGTGLNSALSEDSLRDFRAFLFPGVVLMSVQAPAIAVGASIVWDRRSGFLRQMLVAPVRRSAILVGTCLGGATSGAVYGVLILLLGPVAGVPYRPGLLLVLLQVVLVSFAFTALGVTAAVCIRRPETFQVAVSLCMMPLFFLSGAMFPADGLPGWLGAAVRLNPLTYAVDALRRTMPGEGAAAMGNRAASPDWWGWTPPVSVETGLITVLAVLALAVATRRFSRVE